MSLPEKLERRASRPPSIDPYTEVTLGTVDPDGYSASDTERFDPTVYGYGPNEPAAGGAVGGMAGACSTASGTGADRLEGLFLGAQHANRPVPLEYGKDDDDGRKFGDSPDGPGTSAGSSREYIMARLRKYSGLGDAPDTGSEWK